VQVRARRRYREGDTFDVSLYGEKVRNLIDDHVVIPILFDVGYTLVNPAVKGLTITPMGIISLASVWMEH